MKNEFETKKVTVPLWDDYLEQTENVEGIQKIYSKPFPLKDRRRFKNAFAFHQPKFQKLQVIPNIECLSLTDLLKIARSFNIECVQIKTMKCLNTGKLNYLIYYGQTSSDWDPDATTYATISNDLEYHEEICYGVTELEDRKIIHTQPLK